MTARDFFDRVRDASQDAERCRTQLLTLESRALSLGGGGFGQRVSSTHDPQRQQVRSNAYMDREEALRRRQAEDYDVIDAASVVLYGDDTRDGMDKAVSQVWADVLWWRYLGCAKWATVHEAVHYSVRQCQVFKDAALAWMDETGFAADIVDGIYR